MAERNEVTDDELTEGEASGEQREARPEETPLERAERERGEYLAQWQRARADYQNLKRRTLEDITNAVERERTALLEEVLTVLDHLDMALGAPVEGEEAENLMVGVKMTRDQLWALLERNGVAPIDTDGAFDAHRHQAVSTLESDEHEPGAITAVVRRGFTLGDAVLRYAQVQVAADPGGPVKEAPPPSEEDDGEAR